LANPYIYGALAAFLLLDEREENVLQAIRVTPLSLNRYLLIKVAFFTGLSFVSGVFITLIVGFLKMSLLDTILLNALLALATPFNMIFINSFAKNRVEGFALVKGSGMLIVLPLAAFYIPSPYNVLVGILPGYWPAMAIRVMYEENFSQISYWGYAIMGTIYIVMLIKLLSHRFKKKVS
jgi:fluoroquinolone transport system permease protein